MKLEAKTTYKITQCDNSLLKNVGNFGTITQTHHVQAMHQNYNNKHNTQMYMYMKCCNLRNVRIKNISYDNNSM